MIEAIPKNKITVEELFEMELEEGFFYEADLVCLNIG